MSMSNITIIKNISGLLFLVSIFVFVPACGVTQEEEKSALDAQKKEIIAYVKSGTCIDNSNCQYIGLGSKPCGGPWDYLFYSTSLDTTKLFQMITRYNSNEDSYNRNWGIISDCSVLPLPDSVKCLNGACVGYWNGTPRQ